MPAPQALGYPGLTRPASNPWTPQTFGGRSSSGNPYTRPAALAPSDLGRNVNLGRETFLRDESPRYFGKKKAQQKIAQAFLSRGLPGPLGVPGLLYAAYELGYMIGGELVELPRDWQHPDDRALTFPTGWHIQAPAWPTDDLGWYDQHHKEGERFWTTGALSNPPLNCADFPPHVNEWWEANAPSAMRDPQQMVDGPGDHYVQWVHADARPAHPLWGGHTHGGAREFEWTRLSGTGRPASSNPPRTVGATAPSIVPFHEPLHPPANRPGAGVSPAPRPRPGDNPYLSPFESPVVGPTPGEFVEPGSSTVPRVVTPPTIVVGQPTVANNPVSRPQPPGRDVKERKFDPRRNGRFQYIAQGIGEVTEFLDALDAFYDALPPECKPGMYQIHAKGGRKIWVKRWNPNVKQRAAAVYRCFEHLDPSTVFANVLGETVEDLVIGKIAKRIRKLTPGRPLGLQAGPWDTFYGQLIAGG